MLQSPVGQQIPAKVVSIDKENITLDMNHPLAGKNLTFDITLVDISIPETHDCKDGDCKDGECGDNCNC
jgi:peptidylprolyl isomerase